MNFLEDFFDLFKFTSQQKQNAFSDLDRLIKAKISSDLINQLSDDLLTKAKSIPNVDLPEGQQAIAAIIKQNYPLEQIKEAEQMAIGQTVLSYLSFMLSQASNEDKEKAKAIFLKYNMNI